MKHSWQRDARSLPSATPVWQIFALVVAIFAGCAWGWHLWQSDFQPVQRTYMRFYVSSAVGEWQSFTSNAGRPYPILVWVNRSTGKVVSIVQPGNTHLIWHADGSVDGREIPQAAGHDFTVRRMWVPFRWMQSWLRVTIFDGATLGDIIGYFARQMLYAFAIVLGVGLLFAIPADNRRQDIRTGGFRRRGSQFSKTL